MKDVIKKNNGANFCLADLHVHTPVDKGFKCPEGLDPQTSDGRKKLAKAYIKKTTEKGIEILGITEHNDVSWVDDIRSAAEGSGITVFPGIELAANSGSGGIHILAYFSPDTDKEILDDLITQLGLPRNDRFHEDGSPKMTNKNLNDLLEFITSEGGICTAAHASSDKGILKSASLTGEPRIKAWCNLNLLAAEIPGKRCDLTGFEKNVFENNHDLYKRQWKMASICSSDARGVDDIGSNATLIKLSSKTIGGLKQAFLDWESRIRHPRELETKKYSKIIGAKWSGGFLDGLSIRFNNNLNCLIGGKGTGKSTILETLRYAFGDEFRPEAEKAREQHQEILKEVFKGGSQITVMVEAHEPAPKTYIIERTYNSPPIVKNSDGKLLTDIRPNDIISIEAYGQKEIYEIARDPKFQLSLIDRFIGDKLDELLKKESDLLRRLTDNALEYRKGRNAYEDLVERIERLPALEEKQKRFNESGLSDRMKSKVKYEEEKVWLDSIKDELNNAIQGVEDTELKLIDPIPDLLDEYPSKSIFESIKNSVEQINDRCKGQLEQVKNIFLDARLSIFGDDEEDSDWKKAYKLQNNEYEDIISELKKDFPDIDPDDHLNNESQIALLKPLKNQVSTAKEMVGKVVSERATLLHSLSENRRKQFEVRDKTCQRINDRLGGILRVRVEYEGERQDFLEKIKSFKSKAQQLEKIIESDEFSVANFIQAVKSGPDGLSKQFGITSTSSTKLYNAIKEDEMLDIEVFKIDTKTTIELNVGRKKKEIYHNTFSTIPFRQSSSMEPYRPSSNLPLSASAVKTHINSASPKTGMLALWVAIKNCLLSFSPLSFFTMSLNMKVLSRSSSG